MGIDSYRALVTRLGEEGVSERRACKALKVNRSSIRYESRCDDQVNELIREELRRLAVRHRRFGTPRLTRLIRQDVRRVNHKRVERLYREEGLTLPRKRPRKKRPRTDCRDVEASLRARVWSLDFLHERTEYGQKLKILTVIDEYSRESLEIRVEKRMTSLDVMETLDELMFEHGVPRYVRTDNGPEFVAKRLQRWLRERGTEPIQIDPGSPWQNGYIESFNGKLRDECLNEELFFSRGEAQVIVDWWRQVYNNERPHSSLGYRTPAEVAALN